MRKYAYVFVIHFFLKTLDTLFQKLCICLFITDGRLIIGVSGESAGEDGCTIYSFICLSAGVDWQPCCFSTILQLHAPPKVTSLLLIFVIFGGLLFSLLYR